MKKCNVEKISDLQQKYHEDIIAAMPGHVYWKDKDGVFLGCNLQQARDAGFNTSADLIGKTDYDMPWSIQAEYLRDIDQSIMRAEKGRVLEELFELPDGTKKIYFSNKLPLFDEDGNVSGILGISFDITERKELEENLVQAKELAEAANRAKTEFLENMRHDIRTPLTGIVGFSEIIKKEANTKKVEEYADNLISASHMLLDFLNQILDAIKVLSGEVPKAKQKFSLADMSDSIIKLLKPKSIEKKLKVNFSYDKSLPNYVIGDPTRIQRILLELLSNALNFTEKGRISLKLDLAQKKGREIVLRCTVRDTGIGIPDEKRKEVFLRFKRLVPSYKGLYKGAGLGLTIVKQFTDEIDGEIYCESRPGKGSTFTCLFPLQAALLNDRSDLSLTEIDKETSLRAFALDKLLHPRKKIQRTSGTRVLLVEDQHLAAKVAESFITEQGCSVDVATNGAEALDAIKKNKYELIFMDIGLPDISGNELTKQIRAQEWKLDQHVPIVALTAHIDSENKQTCIASGMDAVLSKPLTKSTAKDIINAFVPAQQREETSKKKVKSKKKDDALLTLSGHPIDLMDGMTKISGNEEAALEMISLLLKEMTKDLPELKQIVDEKNWGDVQSLVHKHRGGCLYCGVPRLRQACVNLDDYLALGKTVLRKKLYQQLLDELEKARVTQLSLEKHTR